MQHIKHLVIAAALCLPQIIWPAAAKAPVSEVNDNGVDRPRLFSNFSIKCPQNHISVGIWVKMMDGPNARFSFKDFFSGPREIFSFKELLFKISSENIPEALLNRKIKEFRELGILIDRHYMNDMPLFYHVKEGKRRETVYKPIYVNPCSTITQRMSLLNSLQ